MMLSVNHPTLLPTCLDGIASSIRVPTSSLSDPFLNTPSPRSGYFDGQRSPIPSLPTTPAIASGRYPMPERRTPRLPLDVIAMIVSQIFADVPYTSSFSILETADVYLERQKLFRHVAPVCRDWADLAGRAFVSDLAVMSDGQVESLLNAYKEDPAAGPRLRHLTLRLDAINRSAVGASHPSIYLSRDSMGLRFADPASIFSYATRLTSIDIGNVSDLHVDGGHTNLDGLFSALSQCVDLREVSINRLSDGDAFLRMVSCWPKLRKLHITTSQVVETIQDVASEAIMRFRLEDLHIGTMDFGLFGPRLVAQLLSSSEKSLQRLTLRPQLLLPTSTSNREAYRVGVVDMLATALSNAGPTLKRLSISEQRPRHPDTTSDLYNPNRLLLANLLQTLPETKCSKIEKLETDVSAFDRPLLALICGGLEVQHLTLGDSLGTGWFDSTDMLADKAVLPMLASVKIVPGTLESDLGDEDVLAFREVCESRGLKLEKASRWD